MTTPKSLPLLLVEGNPAYAEIFLKLLPSLGSHFSFVPTWVDSAEKALAALHEKHFELAFLDYKLPGAGGLSLLTQIQLIPQDRRPAVIMFISSGHEGVALEAMKNGAKDYLSKERLNVPSLLRAITGALYRKQTEDALTKERTLLRSLMESIPDHIYFKDLKGHFLRINNAQARLFHFQTPEAAIGKTDFDLFTAEHAQQAYDDEQRIVTTGEPILGKEEKETWPDGHITWVSTTKVPLRNENDDIIGTFGISRDITQSKQLKDELARKNFQLQSDIEMAREIQEAFLPATYPTFPPTATPEQSALHFHHRYRPAVAIGGDFFSILPINDTTAGVLICDVMGHGVRAALITAILRALIEQHKRHAHDPCAFFHAINQTLVTLLKQTRMPIFASALYIVVDTAKRQLRYANAGHPSLCRIRHASGQPTAEYTSIIRPGPSLGLFAEATYKLAEASFDFGDTILLYTDGLFEAEGVDETRYGQDRLLASIQRHAALPTEKLLDEILLDIEQFSGSTEFDDDLCIIAIETNRLLNK